MLQALAVLAVIELIGLAATPVARGLLGAAARSGGRAGQAARPAAGRLAGVAGREPAPRRGDAGGGRRRRRGARVRRRWSLARRSRGRAADPYRRPLWLGAEIVFVLAYVALAALVSFVARRVGHREADGHGVPRRHRRGPPLPAARPVVRGRVAQLLLPRAAAHRAPGAHRRRAARGRLHDGPRARRRADGGRRLRARRDAARAVGRHARGGRAGRRAGRGARGRRGQPGAARALLSSTGRCTAYDWFAPSRVVPGAINEVPAFSLLVGDLHAHLLALPFTAVALGFVLQVAVAGPRRGRARRTRARGHGAGHRRALRDQLVVGARDRRAARRSRSSPGCATRAAPGRAPARSPGACWPLATGALALLPFALDFEPATNGIGWVSERQELAPFLGDLALLYGLPLWLLAAAYAGRLRATPRRAAVAAGVTLALVVAGALAAEVDLAGALLVAAALGAALLALLRRGAAAGRAGAVAARGGRAGVRARPRAALRPRRVRRGRAVPHEHGLQARLPGVVPARHRGARSRRRRAGVWLPAWLRVPWALAGAVLARAGALAYPVAGWWARTGGLRGDPTLDGMRWLERSAPGDAAAIRWLREHAAPGAVVLEAVGDDYSPDGHARISTFSGRPTVLGWAGHELQWRHDPGTRRADVERIYRWPDVGPPARCSTATASTTSSPGSSSARPTGPRRWSSGRDSAGSSSPRGHRAVAGASAPRT